MRMPLFHTILLSLKLSAHNNIKQIDQILTQTITAGLLLTNPTWNFILRAYSNSPTPIKAILIYNHFIKSSFIHPDNYTYPSLLKACRILNFISKGVEVHGRIIKSGIASDIYVQNSLIHFYGSTGQVSSAFKVFDGMPQRDLASWNSLMVSYSQISNPSFQIEAIVLFREMLREDVGTDVIGLVTVVTVCARFRSLDNGRAVHGYVVKMGIEKKLNLENAFLTMYSKCGEMNSALGLFNEMIGRRDVVSSTILINGYVDKGLLDCAREVFDTIIDKDRVLWNSIVHGYVKSNRPKEALQIFVQMEKSGVIPDENTITSVLSACSSLLDLQFGRLVHQFIVRNNIRQDLFVGTALIDMYSNCGSLEEAMLIFFKMGNMDVVAWTAVFKCLAKFGCVNQALSLFRQMEKQGTTPNEATFVSVLTACKNSDFVHEGCELFKRMVKFYGIQPKIEHFGCVIELLSKARMLDQAEEFLKLMPHEEQLVSYKTMLSACMSYSNIELGLTVADKILKLDSRSQSVYIMLSNFYALAGEWAKVDETRRIMRSFDLRKEQGTSFIEVRF